MARIPIDSIDDPRLDAYRNLKDADLRAQDGRFIAEGRLVAQRLLASRYACESILCIERLFDEMASIAPPQTPIYVASNAEVSRIVGFRFHNGCLACGRATTIGSVGALLESIGDADATLMVAHELNNTENLGAILRIAAGFGAAGLILGPRTADPFFRQSIRVSMGNVFSLGLASSEYLVDDLRRLREAGFETIATVIDADAEPLHTLRPARRQAIVLGSEAHGLDRPTIEACTRRVTIPMKLGTDSLNVAIASAVFLYQLTQPRHQDMIGKG